MGVSLTKMGEAESLKFRAFLEIPLKKMSVRTQTAALTLLFYPPLPHYLLFQALFE